MENKMPTTKQDMITKFHDWIAQRPGLDPYDYSTRSQMNTEYRHVSTQRKRAEKALRLVHWCEYDAELLKDIMSRAFMGRLQFDVNGELQYSTGQYWPTEYRHAAAVVLEAYVRACEEHEAKQG